MNKINIANDETIICIGKDVKLLTSSFKTLTLKTASARAVYMCDLIDNLGIFIHQIKTYTKEQKHSLLEVNDIDNLECYNKIEQLFAPFKVLLKSQCALLAPSTITDMRSEIRKIFHQGSLKSKWQNCCPEQLDICLNQMDSILVLLYHLTRLDHVRSDRNIQKIVDRNYKDFVMENSDLKANYMREVHEKLHGEAMTHDFFLHQKEELNASLSSPEMQVLAHDYRGNLTHLVKKMLEIHMKDVNLTELFGFFLKEDALDEMYMDALSAQDADEMFIRAMAVFNKCHPNVPKYIYAFLYHKLYVNHLVVPRTARQLGILLHQTDIRAEHFPSLSSLKLMPVKQGMGDEFVVLEMNRKKLERLNVQCKEFLKIFREEFGY